MAKFRITLFGENNEVISDRLVEQHIEFTNGPRDIHEGKSRIEANLENQEDVISLIEYLNKLSGHLPISAKQEKKLSPKKIPTDMGIEPLKDLLHTAITKNKSQEALTDYLRNLGFVFVSFQGLQDIAETLSIPMAIKEKHEDYQFMIRRTKLAKDPKNDKHDGQLIFGIKLWGDHTEKVPIYMFGEYLKTKNIPWANIEDFNFKKVEKVYKFPDMLDYAERLRWRKEHRAIELDPNYEPSKFYLKWKPYIKMLK